MQKPGAGVLDVRRLMPRPTFVVPRLGILAPGFRLGASGF
jgi:hypothetical protein